MNNYWFSPKEIFVISLVVFFLYINPFSFFVLGFGGIPLFLYWWDSNHIINSLFFIFIKLIIVLPWILLEWRVVLRRSRARKFQELGIGWLQTSLFLVGIIPLLYAVYIWYIFTYQA